MGESDKIELHTRFFNEEKILYSSMDATQRIEHRSTLAMLIFEARARMNAVDSIDREDRAKLSKDGKEWLVTNSDVTVSAAINEPKIRKERMSKADKLRESMASLGLNINEINGLMGQVAAASSGGSVTTDHNRTMKDNGIKFVKEIKTTTNTQESLLADVSASLLAGIVDSSRPIDDLVSAAKTAGHIANKVMGPFVEVEKEKEFDVSNLFG